jgi:hypothetical protein
VVMMSPSCDEEQRRDDRLPGGPGAHQELCQWEAFLAPTLTAARHLFRPEAGHLQVTGATEVPLRPLTGLQRLHDWNPAPFQETTLLPPWLFLAAALREPLSVF